MAKDSYSAGNLEMQIQAVGTNATASLSSVNYQLKTMKNLISGTTKTLSIGKLLGKLYFIRNYTKQLGRGIANLVQNAIDYTETLNLWQVAMRNNRQEAEKFIESMNKAYGISEQTLMNYQATFKNMLSALGGISEGTSYALSEYLTQMALDYASLYNTSIERAMTVFQSVLSGQVRPIRSISGYDITETTIFQLYQQLGGTKTMRQLSQTEKRLLRIYAVFQQMNTSGAIGDLNKTLNDTSANQLRMLNESLKELGTWLGIIMEQYIKPILPYLNATVITIKNIVKAIAESIGYVPFEGAIESTTELNEELDKITGKLLSFDRFESLNSSADKNILGIDTALLDGLSKYESILNGVTNEATELAKQWTAWWVDSETGTLTTKAQELLETIKGISVVIGVLIGYGLTTKVASLLGSLTGISKVLSFTFTSWKNFGISALIMAIGYLYTTNEDFRESLNTLVVSVLRPLGNILNAITPAVNSLLDALVPIVVMIADFVSGVIRVLDKLGLLEGAVYLVITAMTLWKGLQIIDYMSKMGNMVGLVATIIKNKLCNALGLAAIGWNTMSTAAKMASLGIGAVLAVTLYSGLTAWFDTMNQKTKMIAGTITLLISVLVAATAAWMAYQGTMTMGVAVPIILGAVGAGVAGIKAIVDSAKQYKTGGLVEDGLFQMSKGELFGTFEDGSTVVANNMQIVDGIKQGVYSAVVSAMNQTGNRGGVGNVYLDGKKVGIATAQSSHKEMVRTSLVRANS